MTSKPTSEKDFEDALEWVGKIDISNISIIYGNKMPFDISLEQLPAGYAFTSARSGECVEVRYRDFTSTEDGQQFIQRVESSTYNFLHPSLIGLTQVSCE